MTLSDRTDPDVLSGLAASVRTGGDRPAIPAESGRGTTPFPRSVVPPPVSENDRSDLRDAADELQTARERASDPETAERLDRSTDQIRKMLDADRGPDHGRLDRLMHTLRDVETDLDGEAAEAVGSALEHVRSYRETVDGV